MHPTDPQASMSAVPEVPSTDTRGSAPAEAAEPGLPAVPGVPPDASTSLDAGSAAGSAEDLTVAQTSASADETDGEGRRRRRNRRRGRRSAGARDEVMSPAVDHLGADGTDSGEEGALPVDASEEPDVDRDNGRVTEEASDWFAEVVSGAFDAQVEPAEGLSPEPARRILAPEPDAPKLQKVLAQSGVGSRRDLEQMIVEGRVSVNGQAAHTGQRVSWGDRVAIDGRPVKIRIAPPPPRVIAYHKPVGEVVTHDDPQQRPTVFRKLPRLPRGKWQSVGRLDINTEGLLLFTNSGDLANRLMHPRFGVEREYAVRILGLLSDEARERLLAGIDIEGQPASFRSVDDGGGEGANHWYRVVITEGRNREVRRLFEAVGHAVSRLIRIRYGAVVLPRGLRRGMWVDLGPIDVRALQRATASSHERQGGPPGEPKPGPRRGAPRGRGKRHLPDGGAPMRDPVAELADGQGDDHDLTGPIPNPLQQTYDKRAIQQARRLRDIDEDGPIPNPLQQTYDKRAIQGERRPIRELDEDGPIPNPLQQTYDKRFVQGGGRGGHPGGGGHARRKTGGPRGFGDPHGPVGLDGLPGMTGPKGHKGPKGAKGGKAFHGPKGPKGAGGPGGPGSAGGPARTGRSGNSGSQKAPGGSPDPMRTSVGYIGGDAFLTQGRGRAGKGGRRR